MIAKNITELIGHTPYGQVDTIPPVEGRRFYLKLESFNPMGSVKDRLGLAMILDAEEKGRLSPGSTIVEPTSGNTGIALAFICAQRGYKLALDHARINEHGTPSNPERPGSRASSHSGT